MLLNSLLSASKTALLLSLPFPPELAQQADAHLASLVTKPSGLPGEVSGPFSLVANPRASATAPHKILYAWRIRHDDFRGAALCLWEHLQRVKADHAAGLRSSDIDEEVGEAYLTLINCLSLVDEKMAWILVPPVEGAVGKSSKGMADASSGAKRGERRIVTLEDVRREWQEELDKVADIEAGRYPLGLESVYWDAPDFVGEGNGDHMEVDDVFAN